MLASFAHDLSKLNDSLDYRYDKIIKLLNAKVCKKDFSQERRKNPFILLEQAKENDIKMQRWLNFSTDIVKRISVEEKLLVLRLILINLMMFGQDSLLNVKFDLFILM